MKNNHCISILFIVLLFLGCNDQNKAIIETIKSFPADNLDQVVNQDNVEFDPYVSSDGNGSLKITADSTIVCLFEIGDTDFEDARVVYQAKVKTENFKGVVFLEMWCSFEGIGEFFSRDLQTPITGSTDWRTEETTFILQKGQNPQTIKLNIAINGTGTVWIDDIKLTKGPRI